MHINFTDFTVDVLTTAAKGAAPLLEEKNAG
jgi:hypothetical protein